VVKKADYVKRLIAEVKVRGSYPKRRNSELSLLEEGVKVILMRHLSEKISDSSVLSLRAGFLDWNEVRVSQAQEIASYLKTGLRGTKFEVAERNRQAAMEVKTYLQEIFQKTHGLDLEVSCGDVVESSKALTDLPTLGQTLGGYLLYQAADGAIPVHKGVLKLCEKLGFIGKTSSRSKGLSMLEQLVPKGQEREFALVIHEIADLWDDDDAPIYMDYEVLRSVPYGKKAHASRVALVERNEAKAIRDEKKRVAQEIRDEADRKREEAKAERERKKAAELAAREAARLQLIREKDASKKARILEAKRAVEAKKRAEIKEKADGKKRAIAQKKAAAKKKITDRKKAALKKKADAKKAAIKKADAKKAAAKKADAKKAAAKKVAAKKAAAKKATAKKPAAKKATAKKPAAKKAAAKKPAAKKAAAKKPAAKKAAAKKPAAKKAAAKKPAAKKAAAKKAAAKKPAAKKAAAKKPAAKKAAAKKPAAKKKAAKKPAAKKKTKKA